MPRIAFLFLANHAEVRDGLLNALGGGWNRSTITRQPDGTPVLTHFSIVIGVAFDPTDTTNQANLSFKIESDKGEAIFAGGGQTEIGQESVPITRLIIAALNTEVRWRRPGIHHLTAWIDPNQETRFTFDVAERQPPSA